MQVTNKYLFNEITEYIYYHKILKSKMKKNSTEQMNDQVPYKLTKESM